MPKPIDDIIDGTLVRRSAKLAVKIKNNPPDTLTALRALDGDVVNEPAHVPGDAGGLFLWSADTTTPHDGAIVIAKASGRTGAWKRVNVSVIDPRWFGAKFDGSTNDTAAINAAIAYAISVGAQIVQMPAGEAIIQPAAIDTRYALLIDGDNIELRGAGKRVTKLTFKLYDGSDPATHWPLVAGEVVRGHGIRIAGGSSHIRLADFELDGGAGYTGNFAFPASPVDGDGWDLTHKGIHLYENTILEDIEIEDCDIHSWRGEIVYYGGDGLTDLTIRRCWIHDTNGDGLSAAANGRHIVTSNRIYKCAAAGIENVYIAGHAIYSDNDVYDCDNNGIGVLPIFTTAAGFCDVVDNRIVNCPIGVLAIGPRNLRILDNLMVDCAHGFALETDNNAVPIDNVEVRGNRVVAHTVDVGTIGFVSTAVTPRGLVIRDNTGLVSITGLAAGKGFTRAISINSDAGITFGDGCFIENNRVLGTVNQDTDALARGRNIPLTNTSLTTIASLRACVNKAYVHAKISWSVSNTTNLTIYAEWIGDDGITVQTQTLLSGSQTAGFGATQWSAILGTSSYMTIYAQAGTANRAKVSASLVQEV